MLVKETQSRGSQPASQPPCEEHPSHKTASQRRREGKRQDPLEPATNADDDSAIPLSFIFYLWCIYKYFVCTLLIVGLSCVLCPSKNFRPTQEPPPPPNKHTTHNTKPQPNSETRGSDSPISCFFYSPSSVSLLKFTIFTVVIQKWIAGLHLLALMMSLRSLCYE